MKVIVLALLCVTILSCGDNNVTTSVMPEPTNPQPVTKAGELPENIRVRFDFLKDEVPKTVYEKVLEKANDTYQGRIRHLSFMDWLYTKARIPIHVFDKLTDNEQLFFYTLSKRDRIQVAAYIDYPEELPDIGISVGHYSEARVVYKLDSDFVIVAEGGFGGLHLRQASFSHEFVNKHDTEKVTARIEDAISKRRNGRVVIPKPILDLGLHIIILDIAGIPKEPKYEKWYVPLSKARRATATEVEAYNMRDGLKVVFEGRFR